jgi:hypothetical protein
MKYRTEVQHAAPQKLIEFILIDRHAKSPLFFRFNKLA